MKKLMIVQRVVPSYRQKIFDYIQQHYDLHLITTNHKSNLNSTTNVNRKYIKKVGYINYGGEFNFIINSIIPILNFKPNVIIHEFSLRILSLIPTLIIAKLFKIKFILWGHGFNMKVGFNPKSFKDRIRILLMKNTDRVLLYSEVQKNELLEHVDKSKIYVAQNTLDTKKLNHIKKSLDKERLEEVKKRLIFDKKINITFIGRLLSSKKPEILINILERAYL